VFGSVVRNFRKLQKLLAKSDLISYHCTVESTHHLLGDVMSKTKFIVYQTSIHSDFHEVLVTTPELEESFIKEWFTDSDRDLEEYDRDEYNETGIPIRVAGLSVM
jgi:hypothetical protein